MFPVSKGQEVVTPLRYCHSLVLSEAETPKFVRVVIKIFVFVHGISGHSDCGTTWYVVSIAECPPTTTD